MSVRFEILADDSLEMAAELRKIADAFDPGGSAAPTTTAVSAASFPDHELAAELTARGWTVTAPAAAEKPAPKTEAKPKAEQKPKAQTEPKEADAGAAPAAKGKDDNSDKKAFDKGLDLMMEVYSNTDAREAVRAVLAEFGVKSFNDLPEAKGPELLAHAERLKAQFAAETVTEDA